MKLQNFGITTPRRGPSYQGGIPPKYLEPIYATSEIADKLDCKYCMPDEAHEPIYIYRNPRVRPQDIWNNLKHFD